MTKCLSSTSVSLGYLKIQNRRHFEDLGARILPDSVMSDTQLLHVDSTFDLKIVSPVPAVEYDHCPFGEFGCNYEAGLKDLKQHLRDTPTDHISLLCDAVRDLYSEYRETQLTHESQDRRLDFLQFRIRELDIVFSRQLIWRIDDVRTLIKEARDNVRPSIFSPPFYTGKYGYKLAASIALNGDGDARGEYISIFVTILRGDHDSLLSWPFAHSVTFSLIDQRQTIADRRHIQIDLKPNTCKENKSFLGRPVGDRNPRFGLRKFVKIKEIFEGDYVRDEAIFLKITIDHEEMTHV